MAFRRVLASPLRHVLLWQVRDTKRHTRPLAEYQLVEAEHADTLDSSGGEGGGLHPGLLARSGVAWPWAYWHGAAATHMVLDARAGAGAVGLALRGRRRWVQVAPAPPWIAGCADAEKVPFDEAVWEPELFAGWLRDNPPPGVRAAVVRLPGLAGVRAHQFRGDRDGFVYTCLVGDPEEGTRVADTSLFLEGTVLLPLDLPTRYCAVAEWRALRARVLRCALAHFWACQDGFDPNPGTPPTWTGFPGALGRELRIGESLSLPPAPAPASASSPPSPADPGQYTDLSRAERRRRLETYFADRWAESQVHALLPDGAASEPEARRMLTEAVLN